MASTRREFIIASAGATLVTHIEPSAAATPAVLDAATQGRLRSMMDEIIPKQGNMPSASEAGGLAYFSKLRETEPQFATGILAALDKAESAAPMLQALKQLERDHPAQFVILRDFVFEAYYTQPQVWKLIGYEFHATDHAGPHMKPFDEAVVAKVRMKPAGYREV